MVATMAATVPAGILIWRRYIRNDKTVGPGLALHATMFAGSAFSFIAVGSNTYKNIYFTLDPVWLRDTNGSLSSTKPSRPGSEVRPNTQLNKGMRFINSNGAVSLTFKVSTNHDRNLSLTPLPGFPGISSSRHRTQGEASTSICRIMGRCTCCFGVEEESVCWYDRDRFDQE